MGYESRPPSRKWRKSEAAPSRKICGLSWEFVKVIQRYFFRCLVKFFPGVSFSWFVSLLFQWNSSIIRNTEPTIIFDWWKLSLTEGRAVQPSLQFWITMLLEGSAEFLLFPWNSFNLREWEPTIIFSTLHSLGWQPSWRAPQMGTQVLPQPKPAFLSDDF